MPKLKLHAALIVPLLVLQLACASTGGAKKSAYTAISVGLSALNLSQDVILQVECGKPAAPPAPACVPSPVADQIHYKLASGYRVYEDANNAVRALPLTFSGEATPQILEFIAKIWALVDEVRGLFPKSIEAERLSQKLDTLKAKQ